MAEVERQQVVYSDDDLAAEAEPQQEEEREKHRRRQAPFSPSTDFVGKQLLQPDGLWVAFLLSCIVR